MTQSLIHEPQSWLAFTKELTIQPEKTYVFNVQINRNYQAIKEIYTQVLSEEELKRSLRFFHKEDRERYISSKFFLRTLLSEFLALPPSGLRYHTTANKKPGIEGVSFNVSHSGNHILIAIGPAPVGIDLERINRDFNFESVLDSSFSQKEILYIKKEDPLLNFFTLWTRKEALLKASGEGLTDKLDLVPSLQQLVERGAYSFRLNSFKMTDDYVFSLALAADQPEPVYLTYDHS